MNARLRLYILSTLSVFRIHLWSECFEIRAPKAPDTLIHDFQVNSSAITRALMEFSHKSPANKSPENSP